MTIAVLPEPDRTALWRSMAAVIAAHVRALSEAGTIDSATRALLLGGIAHVSESAPPEAGLQELVATFDDRLDAEIQPQLGVVARIGRGSLDTAAAAARLATLHGLAELASASFDLRAGLIGLAESHLVTLIAVPIHGVAAQPSTIGNWLGGVIGPFARAQTQCDHAFGVTDLSPMGAAGLASTELAPDRHSVAETLGFAGPVDNVFDAVSAVDWMSAAAWSIDSLLAPVERWLQELVALVRIEHSPIRFPDDHAGRLPEAPQWRGPVRLIALLAEARETRATAAGLGARAGTVDYGPVGWALDALLAELLRLLRAAAGACRTVDRLVRDGLEINRAGLANRAGRSFVSSSDLVDFLIAEEQLEPLEARSIAALTISRARDEGLEAAGITPELIDGAALLVIGRELKVEFEAISRYLAPRRFIERRTALGAPSPAATSAWLDRERQRLLEDRARLDERRARLERGLTWSRLAER